MPLSDTLVQDHRITYPQSRLTVTLSSKRSGFVFGASLPTVTRNSLAAAGGRLRRQH